MRCLHCGRELALLKKFTDGEFCSPEHRTQYYDAQQRLIIERLQHNALRLRAYRETLRRKREPELAGFLVSALDLPLSLPSYIRRLEFEASDLLITPPGLHKRDTHIARKTVGALGFVPDFPLPLFSHRVGIQNRLEFLPFPPGSLNLGFSNYLLVRRQVGVAAPIRVPGVGVDTGRLHPVVASKIGAGEFASQPYVPFSGGNVESVSVSSRSSMVGIPGPDPRLDSPALHGDLRPATSAGPASVPPAAYAAFSALPMAGRPFRFRPKAGIHDPAIATSHSIEPASEHTSAQPIRPALLFDEQALEPVAAGTPVRLRPARPVGSATAGMIALDAEPEAGAPDVSSPIWKPANGNLAPAPLTRVLNHSIHGAVDDAALLRMGENHAGAMCLASNPASPAFAHTARDLAPALLTRLFKFRPRGPVADEQIAAHIRHATDPEVLEPGVATPEFAVESRELGPRATTRLFHMRPRAGVDDKVLSRVDEIGAAPVEFAETPVFGSLPAPDSRDLTPYPAQTLIRLKTQSAVASSVAADLVDSSDAAMTVLPEVAHGTLPAGILGDCAPAWLFRLFRMRPRAGVADSTLHLFGTIQTGETELLSSAPQKAVLPEPAALIPDCEPSSITRLFRMRPRAGVTDPGVAASILIPAGDAAPLLSSAMFGTLPAAELADLDPNRVDRPVQIQPRGPVTAETPSFDRVVAGMENFAGETIPATAGLAPRASYEPSRVERMIRLRPRGPVTCDAVATAHDTAEKQISAAIQSAYPSSSGVIAPDYAPAFLDKLYKARPRAGVMDKAMATFERLDVGAIEIILPDVVTPSMPPVLMRQAQMVFRERPIQMRPRGPKPGGTSTFEKIEPVAEDKEKKVREASCMALPPAAIGTGVMAFSAQPAALHAPFAVAGALALQVRASELYPAVHVEAKPQSALPATRGMAPVGDRLFRARPRSAKNIPFALRLEPRRLEVSSEIVLPSPHSLTDSLVPIPVQAMPAQDILRADAVYAVAPPTPRIPLVFANGDLPIQSPVFQAELAGSVREAARAAFWHDLKHRWVGGLFEKWTTLPRDLVWMGASAALLMGVFVHSQFIGRPLRTSSAIQRADIAANPIPPIESAVNQNWPVIRQNIAQRAAIDVEDDFSTGLHRWEGAPNWSASWWYDQRGGVRSGSLAVLRESRSMSDYRFEFSGVMDRGALSWVVRAKDYRNYVALRLVQVSSGPVPRFNLVRYAVINGKEKQKVTKALPFRADPKAVWRVAMDIKGQSYTLMVQGHVVDFWQDGRFESGGVGFFNPAGEHARLHNVRVAHRDDALGKMFALVASDAGK